MESSWDTFVTLICQDIESKTCRSLGGCRRSRCSATTMSGTIGFKVGHKLLLLSEHGFQCVQLRLQLLNGDLRLALRSSRVLAISRRL